jgi:nicotinamidase-related amidase
MATALLLVDTQRDYLERADLTPSAEVVTAAIAGLLAGFRARGAPVLHSRTLVAADGADAMPHWQRSGRIWCRAGTAGALAPDALAPRADEPLLTKRFYSPFENPELLRLLRAQRIARLVIAGLYTHACVRSGVIDAYANGLEVLLPGDAIASYDAAHAAMTLDWLDGRAAQCVTADRILAMLDEGR